MVLNMGQNVIELSQYRDRDHFPVLHTLGNYWNNLADGGVPYRSDLDPRGLSDALRSIVLIERISTGNACTDFGAVPMRCVARGWTRPALFPYV